MKIKKQERRVTYPIMGKRNSRIIGNFLRSLDLDVVNPPQTTDETIRKGALNCANMVCYPLKQTLGNYIEAMERGANTIIAYDTQGVCRFKQYNKLHEFTLTGLGYRFDMFILNSKNIVSTLKKISGKGRINILRKLYKSYKEFKASDEQVWEEDKPNIGIIGEIFSMIDEKANQGLEEKIRKFGGNPYNTCTISDFMKEKIFLFDLFRYFRKDKMKKYKKEAEKYINGKLGGHAFENLYNLLELSDRGVDGIVHILPLSCFTKETLITTKHFNQKKIIDIKEGEEVLTHKGKFRRVLKIMNKNFIGEIININCGGILNFKITPEHPVFALQRKFVRRNKEIKSKPSFIEIGKLKKNDFIAIPKPKGYTKKQFFRSDMKNSKKPKYKDIKKFIYNKGMLRLLGYYLAEGCITYDKHKLKNRKYIAGINFTFNRKENNFIEDIIKIIKDNSIESYCKIYNYKIKPNTSNLLIYNRSLAYLINKLGGSYCDKKDIHQEIMNLSPELQLEVAKGFFRGDGCFTDKFGETTYRAVTTSFKLVQQLFWILIRNNIKCSIMRQEIKNRKKSWMIKISNTESIKRMKDELIKPKSRINNVRFLETKDYFFIPIRKIEKKKFKGKVYNLEVEKDNSYIANFMAVHNCMPETTIEPYINQICKENRIPLLRVPIDENSAEANLETRLETFVELIRMKGVKNGIN